ncbi:MAG: hypothetical protein M3R48_05185 [Candidatus Dormibacteraeota bacterium]|nr:hypothetical protein [Candidatus Dormibacteraeota bacterium]
MPLLSPRRSAPSPAVLAVLLGSAVGLLGFAACAALWRAGDVHAAVLAADSMLLLALGGVALAILGAPQARLRRARVPIGRAIPHAWWPQHHDQIPLVAACVGAPIAMGAGAAVWLLR